MPRYYLVQQQIRRRRVEPNACTRRNLWIMSDTPTATTVDPASRSASSWSALLANLKSRGAPDTDIRVVECRQALAYHRIARSVTRETGQLSAPGADRLRSAISEAVAR